MPRPTGEDHYAARLTEDDVRAIRKRYIPGSADHNMHTIARDYGVSVPMIHKIVSGKSWKGVE